MFVVLSALIESDAEGIGGSGFVECIHEHIESVCRPPIGAVDQITLQMLLIFIWYYVVGRDLSIDWGAVHCSEGIGSLPFIKFMNSPLQLAYGLDLQPVTSCFNLSIWNNRLLF